MFRIFSTAPPLINMQNKTITEDYDYKNTPNEMISEIERYFKVSIYIQTINIQFAKSNVTM